MRTMTHRFKEEECDDCTEVCLNCMIVSDLAMQWFASSLAIYLITCVS